jgi:hypothetical protein
MRALSNIAGILALRVALAREALANACRLVMGDGAGRYHPEAHYMRGPGPRWRAKHARVSARRSSSFVGPL